MAGLCEGGNEPPGSLKARGHGGRCSGMCLQVASACGAAHIPQKLQGFQSAYCSRQRECSSLGWMAPCESRNRRRRGPLVKDTARELLTDAIDLTRLQRNIT
ncbi:hypothetical protein ANN_03578 [Periplaneta americana]|uniref:Uncharacterized protein n=1 Tax=Periplaneta americana TaxID=6978 RepID=A0ABQ8U196_PERAM|nr:hypothetical protein ANN_03578 [Periplaneta americana]